MAHKQTVIDQDFTLKILTNCTIKLIIYNESWSIPIKN